jgi:hypothetical protein
MPYICVLHYLMQMITNRLYPEAMKIVDSTVGENTVDCSELNITTIAITI